MIRPSGNPTTINKPTAFASIGGMRVALSAFNVNYSVGSVARAMIGMAVEDLEKFDDSDPDSIVEVEIFGKKAFVGYVDSDAFSVSGDNITSSVILVHKARDLDESSLFSPGSHPASTEDFSIRMAFQADESTGPSGADKVLSRRDIQFDLTGNIGKEVVKYVTSVMNHLVVSSSLRNLPANLQSAQQTISEQAPKVLAAMKEIVVHGDCKMGVSGDIGALQDAAAAFARNMALGAMGTGKSPWSVLAGLMSAFGLTIICLPDGRAIITPDYAGCTPPRENTLEASIISRFSTSSSKTRPPSAVLAVAYGISSGNEINPVGFSPVVSFTPKIRPSATSGVYTTGLPGWMVPVSRTSQSNPPPTIPEFLGESWAKQIYYQIANINRTMQVTVPYTPGIIPGTVYKVIPTSSVRFMSGGSAGVSKSFSGYCHSVTHSLTPDSNDISTSLVFRNIFKDGESEAMVQGAPLFKDQSPFSSLYQG